jgi:outer membrane protein OmpA-like peptidoglycan-associated protein
MMPAWENEARIIAMRRCCLTLALLAFPSLNRAQQLAGKVSDLNFRILDLNYRIEDTGGKVQDLDIKETPTEVRIELSADVLFDYDKASLLPKAQQTLDQAARVIRDRAKGEVRIVGFTDAKGSDPYNLKLSERRAESVKAWFIDKGKIHDVKFVTQGLGAKNPVAPNTRPDGSDDPVGRQKNRRVEITIGKSAGG